MKKTIVALSIAAVALTATPAFAQNNNDNNNGHMRGLGWGKAFLKLGNRVDKNVPSTNFIVLGSIAGISGNNLTVNVKTQVHVSNITNNQTTVTVDANTKYFRDKNQTVALANLKVGDQIVIQGTVSGSTLTAKMVHVLMPKGKAFGEVTAKTDTSITIKNNVTGTTQTFTTDGNTKVQIDGQAKTTADVQVGDKGFVKFETQVSGFLAKMINLFR